MNKTIVVIDDDPNVLEAVSNALENSGYNVHGFASCDNVFEIIEEHKPDLILLDLLLGDSDGRIICKDIKKKASTLHIPVIIISGADDIYDTINKNFANDIIEKPFTEEMLLTRVKRQLEDSV